MYSDYGLTTTPSTASSFGAALAGFFAAFAILMIIMLAIVIVVLVAKYKLFKKMGIDGWKALIPMVSDYLQMEATGVNTKWMLVLTFGGIVTIIPIIGYLAFLVAIIYWAVLVNVSLARAFGRSDAFAVGLFFLNPIFLCILAFGSSQFEGKKPMNDIIFKN